jgi:hypothetical protein
MWSAASAFSRQLLCVGGRRKGKTVKRLTKGAHAIGLACGGESLPEGPARKRVVTGARAGVSERCGPRVGVRLCGPKWGNPAQVEFSFYFYFHFLLFYSLPITTSIPL